MKRSTCARAGARLAHTTAARALEAFYARRVTKMTAGGELFNRALERVSNVVERELWDDLEAAHGEVLVEQEEEAFLTGFYAGLAVGKGDVS